jgi:hypothetical protein
LVCGGIMAFARDQMPLPKIVPIIFTAPLIGIVNHITCN